MSKKPSKHGGRPERREVVIEKVVSGGAGLARTEEGVVLVPRTAPGERVLVEIEPSGSPRRGRLLEVLAPSRDRVEPTCAIVDRCGGCALLHLSGDAQRAAREAIVREALPASLRAIPIAHHDATPPRGRTRARWHGKRVADELLVGYVAHASHRIVDLDVCVAVDERLERALADVRAILAGASGEGEIDAALGREGRPVLAIDWPSALPSHAYAESERRVAEGRLAGVAIALAGAKTPSTIGDPRPVSTASDGLPLSSPAFGFAQASEVGDAALVRLVCARAEASGKKVLELFSGSGNFTVALAREAAHVVAIEVVEPAVRAARENLEARGLLGKAKLVNADADAIKPPAGFDVVVLDPPRAGARGACAAIAQKPPHRVVYVSCDPATLGRDLSTLLAAGMRVTSIDAVDLFPGTSHVECVVTLVRGG